jgi:hypothetical protein
VWGGVFDPYENYPVKESNHRGYILDDILLRQNHGESRKPSGWKALVVVGMNSRAHRILSRRNYSV